MQVQAGFAVDGITMFNFPIAISEYPFAIRMKRHTFRFAPKTESVVFRTIIAWRADTVTDFEIIRFELIVCHNTISLLVSQIEFELSFRPSGPTTRSRRNAPDSLFCNRKNIF